MDEMTHLIRNAIKTPDGTIIESKTRHDYKSYQDNNGKNYMIDGGLSYSRRSANGDEIDMCLYDDETHDTQANLLTWGSYGINGDQPLNHIPIKKMETSHIKAVLKKCTPHEVLKNCMVEELKRRT
jgi:hypothetical protein